MLRLCAVLCLLLITCAAQAGDRPLPDDDAVAAAERIVRETYDAELATEDGLKSIIKAADAIADDDAGQVAMLVTIERRARALGCNRLGFAAAQRIEARYDCEPFSLQIEYLDTVVKAAKGRGLNNIPISAQAAAKPPTCGLSDRYYIAKVFNSRSQDSAAAGQHRQSGGGVGRSGTGRRRSRPR